MMFPVTIILGALGYLFYKTKKEVALVDDLTLDESGDEDYLYKDIEDLFI